MHVIHKYSLQRKMCSQQRYTLIIHILHKYTFQINTCYIIRFVYILILICVTCVYYNDGNKVASDLTTCQGNQEIFISLCSKSPVAEKNHYRQNSQIRTFSSTVIILAQTLQVCKTAFSTFSKNCIYNATNHSCLFPIHCEDYDHIVFAQINCSRLYGKFNYNFHRNNVQYPFQQTHLFFHGTLAKRTATSQLPVIPILDIYLSDLHILGIYQWTASPSHFRHLLVDCQTFSFQTFTC